MECHWCNERLPNAYHLLSHIITQHATQTGVCFKCDTCSKEFRDRKQLKRHKINTHNSEALKCETCKKLFKNNRTLKKHQKTFGHASVGCKSQVKSKVKSSKKELLEKYKCRLSLRYHFNVCDEKKMKLSRVHKVRKFIAEKRAQNWSTETAVEGNARAHDLLITDLYDLQLTLIKNKGGIQRMLQKDLQDLHRMKWYLSAFIRCQKGTEEPENTVRYMRCPPIITLLGSDLGAQVEEAILGVINAFDKSQGEGSQILFEKVEKIEIRIAKYSPLKGSSYMPLPLEFRNARKGLINTKNYDNKCFLYSCLASVSTPEIHPERVSHYKKRLHEFNMEGISYPVKVKSTLEKQREADGTLLKEPVLQYGEDDLIQRFLLCLQQEQENIVKLRVVMHNLQNYDGHMVLSEIGRLSDGSDITVIPRTKEKYVSFQWGLLRFLDSLGFLNSSLEKLVADLSDDDMCLLKTMFPNDDERALVSRKGVYPYAYFDSFEKFRENCLPPLESFTNDLTGAHVKPEDYAHAINVFQPASDGTLCGATLTSYSEKSVFRVDYKTSISLDANFESTEERTPTRVVLLNPLPEEADRLNNKTHVVLSPKAPFESWTNAVLHTSKAVTATSTTTITTAVRCCIVLSDQPLKEVLDTAPDQQTLAAAFNAIAGTPEFTSIKELTPKVRYEVRNMNRIITKFGGKTKTELKDVEGSSLFVIMPTRLARLSDSQIDGINNLIFSGHAPYFIFNGISETGSYDVELVFDN
ncbi:Histone-lysine N-methyltransferase PRDM16 [Frankliniella fusca]|uniref:Histone-lysine N-methyltransferase PRDM16 n=1 Tax=Frankliniella fusca TaxID=407009 RepID=A0AAE1I312_9NEOP|nr:Histone-lysine N-methyltransferase PRDM16 [Frankliniella fusca]